MQTPLLDDLEAVIRVAERGEWWTPRRPSQEIVFAALSPGDSRLESWLNRANDLVGQMALGRALVGLDPDPDPSDLVGAGSAGAWLDQRVRDVLQWARFDPWRLATEFRLVRLDELTGLGKVFLRSAEAERKELLRVISAEVAEAYVDRWHLSLDAFRTLAKSAVLDLDDDGGPSGPAQDGWWVGAALGLVSASDDLLHDCTQFVAVARPPDATSSLAAVVRTLLEDDRATVLGDHRPDVLGPFVHGMRNRLRPLETAIGRLRTSAPTPEALTWVSPLVDDIERRLRAVDEIVERLSAPLALVSTPVSTLRAAVLEAVRVFETENGLAVTLVHGPDLPLAIPAALLTESILELLRNAREAGATSAEVAWAERAGGGVEVTVRNDGPPIPPPGTQVFERGVSTRGPGRGQGLPHLREALTRHGATLSLADRERVTFVLRTPGRA